MKVENRLETAKLKNYYMIMAGLIFSLSVYYFFERRASEGYIIAALLIAVVYLILLLRKSDYFYLEYNGNKIIVRYYTAHPFFRKYKTFEIPESYFSDYEIFKSLGGLQKFVRFTVKTPKGEGKYPPLSISLLTDEQEKKLIEILEKVKS